ncbi:Enoyl-CoA hydratase/isomerase [Candidatus Bealeia paramacronuclearis]|uniref:Enoyl-CoA hydratase/isomerase n=1 Tax=Candidatus Bealeia paramacronuclearis TaxID=1921001 RepID=A0ABZ2C758_9PROT|nr:Enoyl-CoA hydratase/isomerase [Candidatus Bealeia paramacronuclearis]
MGNVAVLERQDSGAATLENVIVEWIGRVGVVTLNRPQALNALSEGLIRDLENALDHFENEPGTHVIVITGSEKAFAAGADIKEMVDKTYMDAYLGDFITTGWERLSQCRKPVIGAIAGYALGGGCELAMMCDILIAADNAKFAQPEITIGTIPGAGGTQRLTCAIGKSKAMEMCLTGNMISATDAEKAGLVSRVVPLDQLRQEALILAEKIASMSLPVAMMVKECVNRSYETTLTEGLKFERRVFHSTFALEDRKEGMEAFIGKRKPVFKGE